MEENASALENYTGDDFVDAWYTTGCCSTCSIAVPTITLIKSAYHRQEGGIITASYRFRRFRNYILEETSSLFNT